MEFFERKSNHQRFIENEILKIIIDCSMALQLCEELNLNYYHISKKSILKTKNGNFNLHSLKNIFSL